MTPDLHVFGSEQELFQAAAQTFADAVRSVLSVRPRFTVALAGGSTPRALYERLAAPPLVDDVAWRAIEWFWGDERNVGPEDPESNFRLAREVLLSKIDVRAESIHRMPGEANDPRQAADDYAAQMARVFDRPVEGPPPSLDLVLLGMGGDGHTASLFPFTTALDERRRWVAANDVPQLNTRRLTLTYPLLNAASCVLFVVSGAGKAKVLREVLQGPFDPRRLPSQAVQPTNGRLLWYVDRAAAGMLE